MFRKKVSIMDLPAPGLYSLAAELGVEKRFSPRVTYPPTVTAGLPRFGFADHVFKVHDISTGGCSLLDPEQVFGAQVGLTYQLTLDWGRASENIQARLVSRVDHRRNFQFLDLPRARVERIRTLIAPGVRGISLHMVEGAAGRGPVLDAAEVWTSAGGDSVTLCKDDSRVATIYLAGKSVVVSAVGWPRDEARRPVADSEFDAVIMFIANAPQRSADLEALLKLLESLRNGPIG